MKNSSNIKPKVGKASLHEMLSFDKLERSRSKLYVAMHIDSQAIANTARLIVERAERENGFIADKSNPKLKSVVGS